MKWVLAMSGGVAAAAAGFALAGCGAASSTPATTTTAPTTTETRPATTTAPPTTTTVPVATTPLLVYFMRDGKVGAAMREVPETKAVATAALTALVGGPDQAERTAGLSSAISGNQTFRDLRVDAGVASVSLPGSLTHEAEAQVVYTLTQFSSVQSVKLDGRALGRSDFEDVTPAILVESPTPGAQVSSPLHIRGTANTFEATFVVKLLDAGTVVFSQSVTATSGSGTRGTFDVSISFTAPSGPAMLVAFEESAENGEPVHQVQIPVDVQP